MKLCTDCKNRNEKFCHRPHFPTGLPSAWGSCMGERSNEGKCGFDAIYWKPSLWYRIKKMLGVVK